MKCCSSEIQRQVNESLTRLISSLNSGVNCAQCGAFTNLPYVMKQAQSEIQSLEDYKKAYPDIFKNISVQTTLVKIQDLQTYLFHYLEVTSSDLLSKQIRQKQKITKIQHFAV